MLMTIAIDGPVGAGKSSVADAVAAELDILHLDTGAMYRAFAWMALQKGVATDDEAALCALAGQTLPEVEYCGGRQRTMIDHTDVTGLIRTPQISMAASNVSKVAGVRRAMVARQQELAATRSMLLDGRDIGTRVLPNATLKIFLTASPQVRAKRRFDELRQKGDPSSYEEVLEDVMRRDEQDTTREVDPLRPAQGAQMLDTSEMSMEQVVGDIVRRARLKQGVPPRPEERFTPMYKAARALSWFLFQSITPISFHGLENAQMDAPYILIANHQCMLDPLAAGWRCYRYQIRYLGKKELTRNPLTKWLFRKMLMIPVDRHHTDMSAVRECLRTLKDGHALGIFPEGTRHKEGVMEHLESGVAMIALRSQAPLLPVYISGKPRLFHRVHVYYGTPISTTALAQKGVNRDTCGELLHAITQRYRTFVLEHEKTLSRAR